jgi:hypothetical protein
MYQVSGFKFVLLSKRNFSACVWTFYGDGRNCRVDTITTGSICSSCELDALRLSFVGVGSTALRWALDAFSISLSYTQSVELLGRGISPSQGRYLHTEQHKHRINAHNTDIHALSWIRTHDPSVRVSEDSSCLRLRGHSAGHLLAYRLANSSGSPSVKGPTLWKNWHNIPPGRVGDMR